MPIDPKDPKKTATRHHFPELDDLEDLLNPKPINPLSKVEPESPRSSTSSDEPSGPAASPELRRASADTTRARVGNITPSDQMRDFLNRIQPGQDDEIDDIEAARRAGLDRPREPRQELSVRRDQVPAVIASAIQRAGVQNPEWHTINNLPGYMARNIRGMGRNLFGMFTRTPLEDIMTIANVQGQGPNSEAELRAVVGWLRDNADDLGSIEIDYGRAIPGYEPEVREFRTQGVRFHVVRDPMGHYVYAFPEQDAVNHQMPAELGQDRRRLGRQESKENKMSNKPLSEQIRSHLDSLVKLEESIQDYYDTQELLEDLAVYEANKWQKARAARDAAKSDPETKQARLGKHSSLAPILNRQPGGRKLLRWLHREMQLGSKADWGTERASRYSQRHKVKKPNTKDSLITGEYGSGIWGDSIKDARVMWTVIKNDPDNFIVFIGERGVGGLRPDESHMNAERAKKEAEGQVYDPQSDNALPYHYAFYDNDGNLQNDKIDPNIIGGTGIPDKKGNYSRRGGTPFRPDPRNINLLDTIKEVIGKIKFAYAAYPADPGEEGQSVEREKIARRSVSKLHPTATKSVSQLANEVFETLSPIMQKLANQELLRINRSAKRYIDAGNFEGAQKVSQAGQGIRQFLAAIDVSGPARVPSAFQGKFMNVLRVSAQELEVNMGDEADFKEFLHRAAHNVQTTEPTGSAVRGRPELKAILNNFRYMLRGSE